MHRRSRSRSPIGRKGWPPGGKGDYGGWQWHGGQKGGGGHGGWQWQALLVLDGMLTSPTGEIPIGSHPDIARQIFEAGMAAAHAQMGLSPLTSDALRGDLPQEGGPLAIVMEVARQALEDAESRFPPGASASQEARLETSLQHCQGCSQQRDRLRMQDVEGPQGGNMCCLCLLTWQIRCLCAELPDEHCALDQIIELLEFTHRLCTQASPAERTRLDERPRRAAAPPCRAPGSQQSSTSGTMQS